MSYVISIDALKERLLDRIDSLVQRLYPEAAIEGSNYLVDGWEGGAGQALRICYRGNKAGWVKDFRSGEGGDLLTLIARAPSTGCDGDTPVTPAVTSAWVTWSLCRQSLGDLP